MRTFTFNFQPRFAEAVASGMKRQTIRANRKDNKVPVAGDRVRLYRGLRTSKVKLLAEGTVIDRAAVRIYADLGEVVVGNALMRGADLESFAKADGFSCSNEMVNWFKQAYQGDFDGFCVYWTPCVAREPAYHE